MATKLYAQKDTHQEQTEATNENVRRATAWELHRLQVKECDMTVGKCSISDMSSKLKDAAGDAATANAALLDAIFGFPDGVPSLGLGSIEIILPLAEPTSEGE